MVKMKKIIEIDLTCEDDVFERYNRELANKNLIKQILLIKKKC